MNPYTFAVSNTNKYNNSLTKQNPWKINKIGN